MAAPLFAKLQLKPGQKVHLLNPPGGLKSVLAEELDGAKWSSASGADAVLMFAGDLAEAKKLAPRAFKSVAAGGLVWIGYPKGGAGVKTDINRDKLWKALEPSGWRPVRQIALDATWSMMRFRPAEEVGR
jgi:hypothetical protein